MGFLGPLEIRVTLDLLGCQDPGEPGALGPKGPLVMGWGHRAKAGLPGPQGPPGAKGEPGTRPLA